MIGSLVLASAVAACCLVAKPEAAKIYAENKGAVATFLWESPDDEVLSSGTAFFLSPDFVITNVHVAANQSSISGPATPVLRLSSGDRISLSLAEIHAVALDSDIAVIRINEFTKTLFMSSVDGDSFVDHLRIPELAIGFEVPSVGDTIYVIGSPKQLDSTLTSGIVSSIRESDQYGEVIQTTAAISPGSSGSPAFDSNGRVIGVATFQRAGGDGLNFLVPIARAFDSKIIDMPLISWAEEVVTEHEASSATEFFDEFSEAVFGLALASDFRFRPDARASLYAALEQIRAGISDKLDPEVPNREAASWKVILNEATSVMRIDHEERSENFPSRVIQAAMYLDSSRVSRLDILRFAATMGQSRSRDRYLAERSDDELVRWARAIDASASFVSLASSMSELGSDNEIVLKIFNDRREQLRSDLALLRAANNAWTQNQRFMAICIVESIVQGDLPSAEDFAVDMKGLSTSPADAFFGAATFSSIVEAAIQIALETESVTRPELVSFSKVLNELEYESQFSLGLSAQQVFRKLE